MIAAAEVSSKERSLTSRPLADDPAEMAHPKQLLMLLVMAAAPLLAVIAARLRWLLLLPCQMESAPPRRHLLAAMLRRMLPGVRTANDRCAWWTWRPLDRIVAGIHHLLPPPISRVRVRAGYRNWPTTAANFPLLVATVATCRALYWQEEDEIKQAIRLHKTN